MVSREGRGGREISFKVLHGNRPQRLRKEQKWTWAPQERQPLTSELPRSMWWWRRFINYSGYWASNENREWLQWTGKDYRGSGRRLFKVLAWWRLRVITEIRNGRVQNASHPLHRGV